MNLAIARRNPRTFKAPKVIGVRAMIPSDLQYLRERSYRTRIKSIRESHHNIARLAAAGVPQTIIAQRLGYTTSRISVLLADPSLMELVASYRAEVHQSWRDHVDAIHSDATRAMAIGTRNIADRLEALDEDPDAIPLKDVAAITSNLMDRFGYGKHQTQTNINVDFARKLEAAIARSSGKVIDQ